MGWFDTPRLPGQPGTPPPIGTGVTLDTILTELKRRGFPCVLSADAMQGVADSALREMGAFSPVLHVGSMTTTTTGRDLFVFDPASPDYITGLEYALGVLNVWYGNDIESPVLDPLSPLLLLAQSLYVGESFGPLSSTFDYPSRIYMFREKMDNFSMQFGTQGYELYGPPGNPTSFIRLLSPMRIGGTVTVEYETALALADFTSLNLGLGRYLMQWVEAYAAEATAGFMSESAGTDIAGFKTSDAAMKYWERRTTMLFEKARQSQGGVYKGVAART